MKSTLFAIGLFCLCLSSCSQSAKPTEDEDLANSKEFEEAGSVIPPPTDFTEETLIARGSQPTGLPKLENSEPTETESEETIVKNPTQFGKYRVRNTLDLPTNRDIETPLNTTPIDLDQILEEESENSSDLSKPLVANP